MSERETYEAQGRAYATQKRLKTEIATLRADLLSRSQALAALSRSLDDFLQSDGTGDEAPSGNALAQDLAKMDLAATASRAQQLFAKGVELRILEAQIKNF